MSETALPREDAPRLVSRFAELRRRLWTNAGEDAVAPRVVYAGVAAYTVLFVFAAIVHYAIFKEARFDLGNMAQSVWNTIDRKSVV